MTTTADDLKRAAELIEQAAILVREATQETFLPSEAARRSVGDEVVRIRLKLMVLRRYLTIVHDVANRRKPRKRDNLAPARAGLGQS